MGAGFGFTPGGVPDGVRRRKQASTRLLHEWSQTQPWVAPPIYEMRLGPTPLAPGNLQLSPAVAAMLMRANRYADMIGATATQILVVEAKMVALPGAISQLLHYVTLAYGTDYRSLYPMHQIQPVLVWAVDDPVVHQEAVAAGIRVDVFAPQWAVDYLNARYASKSGLGPPGSVGEG
jgi:hypothetical protein